jgi:hypothetical protein
MKVESLDRQSGQTGPRFSGSQGPSQDRPLFRADPTVAPVADRTRDRAVYRGTFGIPPDPRVLDGPSRPGCALGRFASHPPTPQALGSLVGAAQEQEEQRLISQ